MLEIIFTILIIFGFIYFICVNTKPINDNSIKSFDIYYYIYSTSNLYPSYNVNSHKLSIDVTKAEPVYIINDVGISNECCGRENIVHLTGTKELDNYFVFRCNKCGKLFIAVWG